VGHKLPISLLCFIENGPNVISIDKNGHIFVWTYSKEAISAKLQFEPS